MKTFEYIIKDELGIHARPAGALVKEAKKYNSEICILKGDKKVSATKLMGIMAMGIKQGESLIVEINGDDEEEAVVGLKQFLEDNL